MAVRVSKFFNGKKMAFIIRADDYQLALDDSLDNDGGSVFTIDFDQIDNYYKTYIGLVNKSTLRAHSGTSSLFIQKNRYDEDVRIAVEISSKANFAELYAYIESIRGSIIALGLNMAHPTNSDKTNTLYIAVDEGGSVHFKCYDGKRGKTHSVVEDILRIKLRQWNRFRIEWDDKHNTATVYINDTQAYSGTPTCSIKMQDGLYKCGNCNGIVNRPFISTGTYSETISVKMYIDDITTSIRLFPHEKFFGTYNSTLEHYRMRGSLGVITRGYQTNKLDPFNKRSINYLLHLVNVYGFEVATHTRWHHDTPRARNDVEGSIDDIEGALQEIDYEVLTYIFPYGHYDNNDKIYMANKNIPIGETTNPGYNDYPEDWTSFGVTDRLTKYSKFDEIINNLKKVMAKNGVYILLVHPLSYEWNTPEQLKRALSQVLEYVSQRSDIWVTTFGELWSYKIIGDKLKIYKIRENQYRIIIDYSEINSRIWRIPITVEIDGKGMDENVIVIKNGTPLERGDYNQIGGYGSYHEFYRIENGLLYISFIPSGDDTLTILSA